MPRSAASRDASSAKVLLGVLGFLVVVWLSQGGLRSLGASSRSSATAASRVHVLGNGRPIGSAREIDKWIIEQLRGTHSACEIPTPSPPSDGRWKRHAGPLASLSFGLVLDHDDAEVGREITDRIFDKLAGPVGVLSQAEWNLYLLAVLRTETIDGGIDQYFTNSSGNCALKTAAALDVAAPADARDAFRRALAVFPDGKPSEDRVTRYDQIEALGESRGEWDRIDSRVFEGLTATKEAAEYVRRNASAFDLPLPP
jgi:hypothetical protein